MIKKISTPTTYNSGYTPLKRRIAAGSYMKFRTPLLGMEEYVKRNKLRYGGEKHG